MTTATTSAPRLNNVAENRFSTSPKAKRFRRLALEILVAIVYLLLGAAVLEILFRIGHIGEQEYLKLDPVLGMTHLENKLVTDRSEAFAVSRINSVGNCDREHSLIKQPGVFRIAILGDSMTEAIQVPNEERFSTLLEKELNARKDGRFEVINFGNGAFSTGQEYLQFLEKVEPYKPDLTILMFHQGDQEKNAPADSGWSLRPTFTIDEKHNVKARWQEFDAWRNSPSALPLTLFDYGRRHSRIWGVLLQTQSDLKKDKHFKAVSDRFFGVLTKVQNVLGLNARKSAAKTDCHLMVAIERKRLCQLGDLGVDETKFAAIQNESIDRWNLTLTLLEKLNLSCKKSGSQFMVVSLPAFEGRNEFKRQFRLIESLGTAGGFSAVDLTPAFETAQNQDIDSLFLLGHLSLRGHELVSDAILKQVVPMRGHGSATPTR